MLNIHGKGSYKTNFKIITDNVNWSFNEDSKFVNNILNSLLSSNKIYKIMRTKTIEYYVDRYKFFSKFHTNLKSKITCLDYFHGEPKDGSIYEDFFKKLKKYTKDICLIRVPNQKLYNSMFDYELNYDNNICLMPIPVDTDIFFARKRKDKIKIRKKLGIPESIFLIGSFQKDGVGWDEGLSHKLIKGPDIFLKILESFISNNKDHSKNIGILLSGPSRGYIKKGLEKIDIPYWHKYCKNLEEVSEMYSALDCYLVSSRLEGGPKSFLESVSSMVPVISTPVGQVNDLYENNPLLGKTFNPEEYSIILEFLIENYNKYSLSIRKEYSRLSSLYSFKNQSKIWEYKFIELLLR